MKTIFIALIRLYQKIPGPWHRMCRYYPTCSQYALEALEQHGFWKGSQMAVRRLLRCAPWGKSGYDPVPCRCSGRFICRQCREKKN